MEKTEKDLQIATAEAVLMRAAIRSLLATHPDPAALREAWNHFVSVAWQDVSIYLSSAPGMSETMQQMQASMEAYLPRTN